MEQQLTALLATVADGRRHWVRAPQKIRPPYVILQRIGGRAKYHMQGPSGLVSSRVQIDVYAEKYAEAKAIAAQVKALVSGYSAGTIQAIFIDGERDLPAADAGEVSSLFRKSIDISIHHGE